MNLDDHPEGVFLTGTPAASPSAVVRWVGLLLAAALLSTGCVTATPPPGRGRHLGYTPREAAASTMAEGPGVEPPRAAAASSPLVPVGAVGGAGATQARQAVVVAVLDVTGSTRRISGELARLKASKRGLGGRYADVFGPFVDNGLEQLRWIEAELEAATRLANTAVEVEDPDMQLALLRLAGPRLEAAMLGSLLLAVWVDLLHLADVVLAQCPYYSVERLALRMDGWGKMLGPAMKALASLEPGQVEAAAEDLPALMGHLTGEYAETREGVRKAAEHFERMVVVKELLETLTTASAMKMALPRLLGAAAPATLGVGLVAGGDGVMMGTRVVVSAEWVEMMRRLVKAGVISISVVSAAVRIQAGQVMMAEADQELPRGVREALGEGPEVRGMRVTGRAGAGMAEPPEHHVLPREFREWFEKRGFTGEMSIDRFCVKLERASHEAIHGGGDWRLGRMWPGEWNRMIMKALQKAETRAGRMLTPREILKVVADYMKEYDIPVNFTPWRGR